MFVKIVYKNSSSIACNRHPWLLSRASDKIKRFEESLPVTFLIVVFRELKSILRKKLVLPHSKQTLSLSSSLVLLSRR